MQLSFTGEVSSHQNSTIALDSLPRGYELKKTETKKSGLTFQPAQKIYEENSSPKTIPQQYSLPDNFAAENKKLVLDISSIGHKEIINRESISQLKKSPSQKFLTNTTKNVEEIIVIRTFDQPNSPQILPRNPPLSRSPPLSPRIQPRRSKNAFSKEPLDSTKTTFVEKQSTQNIHSEERPKLKMPLQELDTSQNVSRVDLNPIYMPNCIDISPSCNLPENVPSKINGEPKHASFTISFKSISGKEFIHSLPLHQLLAEKESSILPEEKHNAMINVDSYDMEQGVFKHTGIKIAPLNSWSASQKKAFKRLKLKKKLLFLYKFLLKTHTASASIKLIEDENFKKGREISDHIHAMILNSIFNNVFYFLDDEGHLIDLQSLKILTEKKIAGLQEEKCSKIISKKLVENSQGYSDILLDSGEINLIKKLSLLPFPKRFQNEALNRKEKFCLALLQRIYPVQSVDDSDIPILPPITFLYSYKKLLSTPQLFHLIALALELPADEMPHSQKMRILNLCRSWYDSKLFKNDKDLETVKQAFAEIVEVSQRLHNEEISNFCLEIELAISSKPLDFIYEIKLINAAENIKKILLGECATDEINNFISLISNDIKLISGSSIRQLCPSDLMQERIETEASEFSNNMFSLVGFYFRKVNSIIHPTLSKDDILRNYFNFFISLSHALIMKNEFWASFAIFSALHRQKLISQFSLNQSRKDLPQKLKSTDKDVDQNVEVFKKFEEVRNYFSISSNFEKLNKTIERCKVERIPYIPQVALIANRALLERESIKKIQNKNELFFSHIESIQFSHINTLLQETSYHIEKWVRKESIRTNVSLLIYGNKDMSEIKDELPTLCNFSSFNTATFPFGHD